jgi:two-component system, LytTR family, sensor kinase
MYDVNTFGKTDILRGSKFLYHFLFWAGIYLLWVIVFRSYSVAITRTMTIEFCYLIFITVDYYAINNFIVPHILNQRKYVLFVSTIVVVIVISALLRALVALQMNRHFFNTVAGSNFNSLYVDSLINISLWVLLVTMGKMLIDRIQSQRQIEFLEKQKAKNELDYLRAQINPHALFNSLNTVYGHIDKGNKVARSVLLQFSELLRYQLYDCGSEKVNLGKEIEYIKNYVAFQRLRKDENLQVNVQIENIETELNIAPLLLVVLLENAFKFVSNSSDRKNIIIVKISTRGNFLFSTIINSKELQNEPIANNSTGIGISNLKRRLELLYSNKYELTTKMNDDFYETNLNIDLS